LTYYAGLEIYRASGFFQDPQKSGAFLSCLITFLLVLAIRGRLRHHPRINAVVWVAILVGVAALPFTIARAALVSCLLVSAVALFAFNAWSAHVKVSIAATFMVALMLMVQTSLELWIDMLPDTISERFAHVEQELQNRIEIWFDTWDMFADHPLTGIGLGSFKPYLLETRPGVYNYYGIGSATGVPYIPDQPENGYLQILYEGGIIGTMAALLVVGDAIRRAFAVVAGAGSDADARTECIAALAALATFAVTFVTLFTVTDPRIGALLVFLLAVIWHRSLRRPQVACDV
jgi:O-antigen ligase